MKLLAKISTTFAFVLAVLLITSVEGFGQENVRKTEREVNSFLADAEDAAGDGEFASAEALYRKAISKDPSNATARYNMGNLYYEEEKPSQAEKRLEEAAELADTKEKRHKVNHNLGNSYMQQEKYQEAVEAYKNALRNDPADDETRYNLALAKKKLEEQQDEQEDSDGGGDDDQEQDQDQDEQDQEQDQNGGGDGDDEQNDQEQSEDGQPQDEGDQEQDEGEGDQEEDEGEGENEDQQQGDEGDQEQEQPQPQPAQGQLSPEQIRSLLEAMNNEERKVQDKINAEKAKGAKTRSEKDW